MSWIRVSMINSYRLRVELPLCEPVRARRSPWLVFALLAGNESEVNVRVRKFEKIGRCPVYAIEESNKEELM